MKNPSMRFSHFSKWPRTSFMRLEWLEDRVAPARGISPTEILAGIDAINPLGVLWRETSAGRALGIDLAASTVIGPGMVKVALASGTDPETVVSRLKGQPNFTWVQPNYVYDDARIEANFTPVDPLFAQQGSLPQMRVPDAWDTLITAGKNLGNSNTLVAVLDEGVNINLSTGEAHQDLTNAIYFNQIESATSGDDDGNGVVNDIFGYDFVNNDNDPSPLFAATHGNEVAGVIAARTNTDKGIAGIAGGKYSGTSHTGGVKILPVRVLEGSTLTSSALASGLNYAASMNVRIANLSFNLDPLAADTAVQSAMTALSNAGTLIVASAGNDGASDAARRAFEQVLFVANVDANDKVAGSSNRGAYVDISAPGESIYTTGLFPNTYIQASGTSLAAPAVAGVAALMIANNPSLSRDQLAARLLGTATLIDTVSGNTAGTLGTGRVDAYAALAQASIAAPTIGGISIDGKTVQNFDSLNAIGSITLTVPQRFNPASVTSNSFDLRGDGPDNLFNTADDVIIPLTVANPYRMGSNSITLNTTLPLPGDRYQFTAKSGHPYLRDPFDTPLNGTAGSHFTRTFDVTAAEFGRSEINPATSGAMGYYVRSAFLNDGGNVFVWTGNNADGPSNQGILARIFDANGNPRTAEFLVNSTTAGTQYFPTVAGMADGGFVVSWTDVQTTTATIKARRFNASGIPLSGGEITVSAYTISSGAPAFPRGDVTASGSGYAVTYTTWSTPGGPTQGFVRVFSSADIGGTAVAISKLPIINAAQVAAVDITTDPAGNIAVAFTYDQTNGVNDAYYSLFSANGTPVRQDIKMNQRVGWDLQARQIAFDSKTGMAVGLMSGGQVGGDSEIIIQRFTPAGDLIGLQTQVNQPAFTGDYARGVAFEPTGNFAVLWESNNVANTDGDLFLQRMRPDGSYFCAVMKWNSLEEDRVGDGSLVISPNGDISTGWSTPERARYRFTNRTPQISAFTTAGDINSIANGERVVQPVSGFTVSFNRRMMVDGTNTNPGRVNNLANWQLFVGGLEVPISSVTFSNTQTFAGTYDALVSFPTVSSGSVVLKAKDSILDAAGNRLDGDSNGSFGGEFSREFSVAQVDPISPTDTKVNTNPGTHFDTEVDANAAGQTVVVWWGPNGADTAIFAQRFNANGTANGAQIIVASVNPAGSYPQQCYPDVAVDAAGNFVVTWLEAFSATNGNVKLRAYRADGTAGSIVTANATSNYHSFPKLAMAPDGRFVLVFGRNTSNRDVYAIRYDAPSVNGTFTVASGGSESQVNTSTGSQDEPAVAMDANGNYVIGFSDTDGTTGQSAVLFRADGTRVGAQFALHSNGKGGQDRLALSMADDGSFVAAWVDPANDGDIKLRQFNGAGVPLAPEYLVHINNTAQQHVPSVAVDADGDFLVAWQSQQDLPDTANIYGQRYNAAGVRVGAEFRLNNTTNGAQQHVDLAATGNGDFIAVWKGHTTGGGNPDIGLRRLGAVAGLTTTGIPALSMFEDATKSLNLTGVFTNPEGSSTFTYYVADNSNPILFPGLPVNLSTPIPSTFSVTPAANQVGSGTLRILAKSNSLSLATSFVVAVQPVNDAPTFVKGADLVHTINSTPQSILNWASVVSTGPNESDAVIYEIVGNTNPEMFKTLPSVSANGTLSYEINAGVFGAATLQVRAVDNGGTANGGLNASTTQAFAITADPTNPAYRVFAGDPVFVNSTNGFSDNNQNGVSIASGPNGNSVVVWQGAGNGDADGVFAQIFGDNGQAIGANFRVNTTTTRSQINPSVGLNADGTFAVTWASKASDTLNDYDVLMQRYTAFGVAIGGEVTVSPANAHSQYSPSLASWSGGYVVVYTNTPTLDGQNADVKGQLFSADGAKIGGEFTASTEKSINQQHPDVAMDAVGSFMVVWDDATESAGLGYGTFARHFTTTGVGGPTYQIHTLTAGDQEDPRIASSPSGQFVAAWSDDTNDVTGSGVYARRLTATGPVGTAFRVNTTTALNQEDVDVGMDADGDFTITWRNETSAGVYDTVFQRYDRNGTAIGKETVSTMSVSATSPTNSTGNQTQPRVAVDADGDAILAWVSSTPDASGNIYVRRHGYPQIGSSTIESTNGDGNTGIPLGNGSGFTSPTEALGFVLSGTTNSGMYSNVAISGGRLKYAFKPGEYGSSEATVRATDVTEGTTGTTTVILRYVQSNASPLLDFIRNKSMNEGGTLVFTATAIDRTVGGAALVYSILSGPGSINSSTGVYTFTAADSGPVDVKIRVTDPVNNEYTQETFTINVANVAPTAVFSGPSPAIVAPNTSPIFSFTGINDVPLDLSGTMKYEFDWDNNGTYDFTSSTPSASAPNTYFTTPGSPRTVKGRITDKDGGSNVYFASVVVDSVSGAAAPIAVTNVTVNGGAAQRSNVTSIAITFNQPVAFSGDVANAVTLTRAGSPGFVPLDFTLNGNVLSISFVASDFTQTSTLNPSLIDGVYSLRVVAANVLGSSGPMMSDHMTTIKRLFGDVNGDGTVDGGTDFAQFGFRTAANDPFDYNMDGTVDGGTDFAQFGTRFGRTL